MVKRRRKAAILKATERKRSIWRDTSPTKGIMVRRIERMNHGKQQKERDRNKVTNLSGKQEYPRHHHHHHLAKWKVRKLERLTTEERIRLGAQREEQLFRQIMKELRQGEVTKAGWARTNRIHRDPQLLAFTEPSSSHTRRK
jgi:hypothetical protein